MACRMYGAKPSFEPMLVYCQDDPWKQWNLNRDPHSFIQENVFDNVAYKI